MHPTLCLAVTTGVICIAAVLSWGSVAETSKAFSNDMYNASACKHQLDLVARYNVTPMIMGGGAAVGIVLAVAFIACKGTLQTLDYLANETQRCIRTTTTVLWVLVAMTAVVVRHVANSCFETKPASVQRLLAGVWLCLAFVVLMWAMHCPKPPQKQAPPNLGENLTTYTFDDSGEGTACAPDNDDRVSLVVAEDNDIGAEDN